MKVSIAIPTYECKGNGWLFLSELLNSISKQSYKDCEIVISDQSTDDKIVKLVSFYSSILDIKLVDGHSVSRSNSPNANNCIKHCSGDIIKIMFMDDFFVDDYAIQKIVNAMSVSDKMWCINGCVHCSSIHYVGRKMIPFYNHQIHLGNNTISSPSVLSIREKVYFDEKLAMLMDCELYKRLYTKYGEPLILEDHLICNRVHSGQLQNSSHNLLPIEQQYCHSLYGS